MLKVLKMIHPKLKDLQIIQSLGTYKGMLHSGLAALLSPTRRPPLQMINLLS